MDKASRQFLLELLTTPSPTGFEIPGQRVWAKHVKKHADKVESDAYGSVWACLDAAPSRRKSTPTVMIEAHADEIGYMIKHITKEGFLRIDRIGGSDVATARGRRLRIFGDRGVVTGIIGNTAIHLRKTEKDSVPEVHDLYVDVGAKDQKAVEKLGLRVGHPAVYADEPEFLGTDRLTARALDNRIGGFIIARAMARLASRKTRPAADVIALNAVQEEIGGFGARMASYRIMPDVCLVLDVTHATDCPGIDDNVHGTVALGGGPSLTHGTSNHPEVVKRLMTVAKSKKIPIQHEASSRYTGTDTDSIFYQRSGIPSALISLPQRYMHSVVELVDLDDVEHCVDLMVEFVLSIKPSDDFSVRL